MSVATTRPFARPPRTASATSRVFSSVTRSPRTKLVCIPSRSAHSPTKGPPPCTTTSGWPESDIATTASSAESLSDPTDPPIFSTTTSLRRVVGIDPHVLRREVRPPRARGPLPEAKIELDGHVLLREDPADRLHVEGPRAGREYDDVGDPDGHLPLIHLRARAARRREDAAPVGVGAVDRGLHEVGGGDRPRRPPRVVVRSGALHPDLEYLGDALAVGDDLAQVHGAAGERNVHTDRLLAGVGGHDRSRHVAPPRLARLDLAHRVRDALDRERNADDPRARDGDLVRVTADLQRGRLSHRDG